VGTWCFALLASPALDLRPSPLRGQVLFPAQSFQKPPLPACQLALSNRPATFVKGSIMSSKIYVGNLPYTIDDASLRQNFSEFGGVLSAKVMMDRDTGRSKGFAFVEMSSAEEAQAAITGLNGMSVSGRSIVVNISKPKEPSTGYGSGYRDTRN
jgi:RNA recognition motif-containing protein